MSHSTGMMFDKSVSSFGALEPIIDFVFVQYEMVSISSLIKVIFVILNNNFCLNYK